METIICLKNKDEKSEQDFKLCVLSEVILKSIKKEDKHKH